MVWRVSEHNTIYSFANGCVVCVTYLKKLALLSLTMSLNNWSCILLNEYLQPASGNMMFWLLLFYHGFESHRLNSCYFYGAFVFSKVLYDDLFSLQVFSFTTFYLFCMCIPSSFYSCWLPQQLIVCTYPWHRFYVRCSSWHNPGQHRFSVFCSHILWQAASKS